MTIIEPGGFATRDGNNPDPLANGHMATTDPAYDGLRQRLGAMTGKMPAGDPAAAAQALLKLVDSANPPLRVLFGKGFQPMIERAYADRLKTWSDWQELAIEAHGALEAS
ncbi:hypothetical protein ACFMQL_14520 [Nonomuraea fastidiosa]|uniref:hypothetical protein n=2 Tax=Streptosporangiaceae TaxID=2004 RepID=UPI003446C26D